MVMTPDCVCCQVSVEMQDMVKSSGSFSLFTGMSAQVPQCEPCQADRGGGFRCILIRTRSLGFLEERHAPMIPRASSRFLASLNTHLVFFGRKWSKSSASRMLFASLILVEWPLELLEPVP